MGVGRVSRMQISMFHSIRTMEAHCAHVLQQVNIYGQSMGWSYVCPPLIIFFGYGNMVFSVLGRQNWWQGRKLSLHVGKVSLSSVCGFSLLHVGDLRSPDIETCKSKLTMTIDQAPHKDIGFLLQSTTCTIHHFTFFTFWDIEDIHHISSTYASSQVTTITTSSGCYCHLSMISTRLQELTTRTHSMSQRGSLRLRICLL
jgi:hypothetical protein